MTIYIGVPDRNDSFSRIVLVNREYLIRFMYNGSADYWTFGLYDTDKNQLLQQRKIVPLSPLSHFDKADYLPAGIFGCLTKLQRIGRDDFNTNKAKFAFIPWDELGEWRETNAIL